MTGQLTGHTSIGVTIKIASNGTLTNVLSATLIDVLMYKLNHKGEVVK